MKTFILTLALAATISLANAQTETWPKYKAPEERAKIQTENLNKQLHLSETQAKKVFDIYVQINKKYEKTVSISSNEYQSTLNKIGNERDAMMEDVLNCKQFVKYQKMR